MMGSLALLFALTVFLSMRTDEAKTADWTQTRLTYLPGKKMVKAMALGNESALGSLLWVKGLIYSMDAYFEKTEAIWFGHMLDVITHLNPRFKPAYDKGTLYLSDKANEQALRIAKKGMEQFPKDWQLRVYAAMFQIKSDSSYELAAEYLEPLAAQEGVPDYVRLLPATFKKKAGHGQAAMSFLLQQYFEASEPMMREMLLRKMIDLHAVPANRKDSVRNQLVPLLEAISQNPALANQYLHQIAQILRNTT